MSLDAPTHVAALRAARFAALVHSCEITVPTGAPDDVSGNLPAPAVAYAGRCRLVDVRRQRDLADDAAPAVEADARLDLPAVGPAGAADGIAAATVVALEEHLDRAAGHVDADGLRRPVRVKAVEVHATGTLLFVDFTGPAGVIPADA